MKSRPYAAQQSFAITLTLLLVLAAQTARLAASVERPPSVITVRTYSTDAEWVPDLDEARLQVDTIFGDVGIAIVWLTCRPLARGVDNSAAACRAPLKSNELAVRIMAAHDGLGKHIVLGEALVNPRSEAPCLSTIFVDRVVALSRKAGVRSGVLLGRAIAHELGHLLLGTSLHSEEGLMRAQWTRGQLQRNRPGDWNFVRGESTTVRAAAMRREIGSTAHSTAGTR